MKNTIILTVLALAVIMTMLTQHLLKPPKKLTAYYASEICEYSALNREYVNTLIPDSRNAAFTFNEKLDGFTTRLIYSCSEHIGGSYPMFADKTSYVEYISSTSYSEQVSMLSEWQYEYRANLLPFHEEFKVLMVTYKELRNNASVNKTKQFENTKNKVTLLTTFFNNQFFRL